MHVLGPRCFEGGKGTSRRLVVGTEGEFYYSRAEKPSGRAGRGGPGGRIHAALYYLGRFWRRENNLTQASYGYPSRWWWSGGRVPRQQPNKPSEKGKEDFHCGGHGGKVPWAMFTQLPLSHPPSMFWVLLDVKF